MPINRDLTESDCLVTPFTLPFVRSTTPFVEQCDPVQDLNDERVFSSTLGLFLPSNLITNTSMRENHQSFDSENIITEQSLVQPQSDAPNSVLQSTMSLFRFNPRKTGSSLKKW